MLRNPTTDLIVILVIVLLILGPKRLPGLGKSLGQGMREFKDSISGDSKNEETDPPALSSAPPAANPRSESGTEPAADQQRDSAEVGSERHP
jgi:sec-independent protein translocase protein TatA